MSFQKTPMHDWQEKRKLQLKDVRIIILRVLTKTGNLETGLLFISFQKSPQQFIDIQNHLGHKDKLNEYITHRGTATFIVLPGVQKGGYLGETLFN